MYVDTDFECLRSLEALIADSELVVGLAKPGRVSNALLGARAGHPIVDEALARLRPSDDHRNDKRKTATRVLDALLIGREGVTCLAPAVLYPRSLEEREAAYAIRHQART